jgi:hypothetical protein
VGASAGEGGVSGQGRRAGGTGAKSRRARASQACGTLRSL